MGVLLRYRKLKGGKRSYYLDINHNGQRYREFIGVKISERFKKPIDRSNGKSKDGVILNVQNDSKTILRMAEAIRNQRERELLAEGYEVEDLTLSKISFTEYFRAFKDNYKKKDVNKISASFLKFEEFFGEIRANQLSPNKCEEFRDFLKSDAGLSGETPSSYFGAFRKVVNKAYRGNIFKKNPIEGITIKKPHERLTKQVLTIDELQLLEETHCGNPIVKKIFLFACNTGLGLKEIRTIQWKNIVNGKIVFQRAKTETPLTIPLNLNSRYYLGKSKGKSNDYIFSVIPSDTAVNKVIATWMKRAKINKHITFYCSRHSFACNLVLNGASAKTTSGLLGHKSLHYTDKYLNYVDELKDVAVNALPIIRPNHLKQVV